MRAGISLLVLSVVFGLLETKFVAVPRRSIWRRDRRTDFLWWFLTPLFARLAAVAAVITFAIAGFDVRHAGSAAWFRNQPLAAQWVEVLIGADLLGYWIHRAFHRRPLWAIHAVHHSSETLDWLAAARVHPLNEILSRVAQLLPFALLGIDPRVIAGAVPLLTFNSIFIHANISWDYGPLRYVIASPRFHRWHHTSEEEGLDKNFAGLFPWIDALFGTFHMPAGRQPEVFGVRDGVPAGWWAQLAYPLRQNIFRGVGRDLPSRRHTSIG